MSKPLAYLSGKITGDPNYKAKFAGWAALYRGMGFEVINPVELDTDDQEYWVDPICRDLRLLSEREPDFIVMLPDWSESPGAIIEHVAATMKFGVTAIYEKPQELVI